MKTSFICILLIFSIQTFAGGPWINKSKSGFFQIQNTFPTGGYNLLFFDGTKERALKRPVIDYTIQAYLEYGITDRLNIISTLPYKYVSTGELIEYEADSLLNITDSEALEKGSLSGLSNYSLSLKYGLLDKGLKLAISLNSSFNTISKDLDKGLITGYDANSVGLYLHAGKSFNSKIYSFVEAGFNKVGNNFSDYIEVKYELGYQIKPSLWTGLTLNVRESLENGSYNNLNLQETSLYTNDQEYFSYGLKGSYELKNKIGFTLATFGAFYGNNVGRIPTFSIGVYKKW